MSVANGGRLAEPAVLAIAKQHLFAEDAADTYAVTDTQFATQEWRAGSSIDDRILSILTPFNHVRLGTGYPDLVGVGPLETTFVDGTSRGGEATPLVAVEAKGYAHGGVDVERGIIQAHDRLTDANVAYLAAPENAISSSARSIARELNVGVLGVTRDESLSVLEIPRVVGARASESADAIRFQATAQGVAGQSFGLNHPKNYLAYPLAIAHHEPAAQVMERYVVGAVDSARKGAEFLGLIARSPGGDEMTNLGREVVRFAIGLDGSVDAAISRFAAWRRSKERFVDIAGEWGTIARWVVYNYPATELLVSELQRLHDSGHAEPVLPDVVLSIFEEHPTFAVELFVRGTEQARQRVFRNETTLDPVAL